MAQRINVTIPGPGPWGFRLAGGRDFNQPLYISKVTPGGKAHRSNILENDTILAINGRDMSAMTHLEAQNLIKGAVGNLAFNLERSSEATIWTPEVQQQQDSGFNVSLKANKQQFQHAGSSHNAKPRLFPGGGGGGPAQAPAPVQAPAGQGNFVHKQFNSPVGIYSAQNVAESYRGQTEGYADQHQSDYQQQQQQQQQHQQQSSGYGQAPSQGSRSFNQMPDAGQQNYGQPPPAQAGPGPAGMRSVRAPVAKPSGGAKPADALPTCNKCNRNIMGPFVKVRGNPLHDTCFTCESCALTLRNKGFFVINEKLYCESCKNRIQQRQNNEVNGGYARPNPPPIANKPSGRPTKTYTSTTIIHANPKGYNNDMAAPPPPPPPPPGAGNFSWRSAAPPAPSSAPSAPSYRGGPPPGPKGQPPRAVLPQMPSNFGARGGPGPMMGRGPRGPPPPVQQRGPPVAPPPPNRGPVAPPPMARQPPAPAPMASRQPPAQAPMARQPPAPAPPAPSRAPMGGGAAPAPAGAQSRTPFCEGCNETVRGTYVSAFGRNWHPEHFVCAHCHENLQGKGVIEDKGKIYCEEDYMRLYAPKCAGCMKSITGECVKAMGSEYHPDCFKCVVCHQPITDAGFHMQDGQCYCKKDFTNKFRGVNCGGCNFPIEAGEAWLEALDKSYHAECFTCAQCSERLEGQRFYARGGQPFCQAHGS